jgi:hypothetical protein
MISLAGSCSCSLEGISRIQGSISLYSFMIYLRCFSAIICVTRITDILSDLINFLNVSSIKVGFVSGPTIKKFVSPLIFLSPIPVNKKPVTVSSSPITATSFCAFPYFNLPFLEAILFFFLSFILKKNI